MAKLTIYRQTALWLMPGVPAEGLENELSWGGARWQPNTDLCQTEDEICIHVEIAGLKEADLAGLVRFEPGRLIIEGQRDHLSRPCQAQCRQIEIETGAFRRVLPLPADADASAIQADYENGLLSIHIPRRSRPQPQNVRVEIE